MDGIFGWLNNAFGQAEHFLNGAGGVIGGLENLWNDATGWFSNPNSGVSNPGGAPRALPPKQGIPWTPIIIGGVALLILTRK